MNLFRRTTRWSVMELALLKISLLAIGATAGIYFSDALKAYLGDFAAFAAITGVAALLIGIRKLREN